MKKVAQESMKTIDFEKAFISLQRLAQPLKLGHKMRIVIDYDSTSRHIKMNYLDINKDANPDSLPNNVQFNYARENGGKIILSDTGQIKAFLQIVGSYLKGGTENGRG